jgi:hypothetical protein
MIELTKIEKELQKQHDRLLQQKKPYERVAENARQTYGSDLTPFELIASVPVPHRNFYKEQVQTHRGKLVEGEPQTQMKGRNLVSGEAVQFFERKINPIFTSESVVMTMQSGAQDTGMYMHGYFHIMEDGTVEWLNWFDVYVNNALANPKNLFAGKSILVRRVRDVEDFKAEWKSVLSKLEYEVGEEDTLPRAKNLPGRSPVGVEFADRFNPSEKRTSIILDSGGRPFRSSALTGAFLDGSMDALVEEWWHFRIEEDGWKLYKKFEGYILNGENRNGETLDEWMPNPSIVDWSSDYLGGTYYQSMPYGDMIHSQAAYNFTGLKIMQNIALIDRPVLVAPESMKTTLYKYNNKPGEILFETVPNGLRQLPPPTFPPEYLAAMDRWGNDSLQNGAVQDVVRGEELEEAKSGIAIAELKEAANTRFKSQIQSRDEALRDVGRWLAVYVFDREVKRAKEEFDAQFDVLDNLARIDFQSQASPEDFMPEELRGLTHDDILNDLMFSFKIVPPTNLEDKILLVVSAVERLSNAMPQLAESSPETILQLAGHITENTDLAEEMISIIQPGKEQAAEAEEDAIEQQIEAAEDERVDELDAKIEEIDAETEGKIELARVTGEEERKTLKTQIELETQRENAARDKNRERE